MVLFGLHHVVVVNVEDNNACIVRVTELFQMDAESEGIMFSKMLGHKYCTVQKPRRRPSFDQQPVSKPENIYVQIC